MPLRSRVLWTLSALLLVYLIALAAESAMAHQCAAEGGHWSWRHWHCRPLPAIELRRDLERT